MVPSQLQSAVVASALATSAALAEENVVYWVSAPVQPGETVMMCGFFPQPDAVEIAVERLADQDPGEPSSQPWQPPGGKMPETVEPLQTSETALMFELPKHGAPGVYYYAVHSDATDVRFGRLNAPTPWWTLGDVVATDTPFGQWRMEDGAVYAGGRLRILGRCLKLGEKGPTVALRSKDGHVTLLQPEKAEPFSLAVTVPEELALGHYELFVHNGYGGQHAWSEPLDIAVLHREEENQPLIDVADFGAKGDDEQDDTDAIQSALKEAGERGGAVVLVPRGRFVVSEKLVIPPHITLRGAGQELTALCMADTDDPPDAWIEGSHHFAIEDLTLYCNHHYHVISNNTAAAVHAPAAPIEDPETAGHVRLARVRVRADSFRGHLPPDKQEERARTPGPRDTIRLSGPDIRITDCDVYGSERSIYLHYVVGAVVENNIFYNGRSGWMNFNGCENIVFEGNRIVGADLMSTGGGYACFTRGVSRNIYTAHNSYENMNGWDREAFTSDAGGGAYFGPVVAVEGDWILLADDPKWQHRHWTNTLVAVIAGRGRGQYRFVKSWDGRRVQLDRPFDVSLDETSRVTVTMTHRRYIFYDNETRDAGIAIQFYGTATEHIVANNRSWRADGFRAYGFSYTGGVQPNLYLQFLGNEIREGNCYRYDDPLVYPARLSVEGTLPSLHFGSVLRNNHLHNNAQIEVGVGADSDGATENVVVEGNAVENADLGILVDAGCRNVLLRRNQTEHCLVPLLDNRAQ